MSTTKQPPLERIPRPVVYEVPWFEGAPEPDSVVTGESEGSSI